MHVSASVTIETNHGRSVDEPLLCGLQGLSLHIDEIPYRVRLVPDTLLAIFVSDFDTSSHYRIQLVTISGLHNSSLSWLCLKR
jgi:hypothetical protein